MNRIASNRVFNTYVFIVYSAVLMVLTAVLVHQDVARQCLQKGEINLILDGTIDCQFNHQDQGD